MANDHNRVVTVCMGSNGIADFFGVRLVYAVQILHRNRRLPGGHDQVQRFPGSYSGGTQDDVGPDIVIPNIRHNPLTGLNATITEPTVYIRFARFRRRSIGMSQ